MSDIHEPTDAMSGVISSGVVFTGATPILRVAEFRRSIAYYEQKLGFTLEWSDGDFGCVRRDDATIMLSEGSQGCSPTWLWLSVTDVDALHAELVSRGADIRPAPTNYPWGSREVHVFDADRHVLRLGSGHMPGEPLGAWLDESGVRWMPNSDGGWTRVDSPDGAA